MSISGHHSPVILFGAQLFVRAGIRSIQAARSCVLSHALLRMLAGKWLVAGSYCLCWQLHRLCWSAVANQFSSNLTPGFHLDLTRTDADLPPSTNTDVPTAHRLRARLVSAPTSFSNTLRPSHQPPPPPVTLTSSPVSTQTSDRNRSIFNPLLQILRGPRLLCKPLNDAF
jgi:hypothetical protein